MMNSSTIATKKPALCRYFANSGSCFYGEKCQFVHETLSGGPARPTSGAGRRNTAGGQPGEHANGNDNSGPPADANNGDQFFNATFGGTATISNGLSEFPPAFLPRQKVQHGGQMAGPMPGNTKPMPIISRQPPMPPGAPPLPMDPIRNQFMTLSITGSSPQSKFQTSFKHGRNPGATEFVPNTSVPSSGVGLTHSSSSPAFTSHLATQQFSPGEPFHPSASGMVLSAGTSPRGSPARSPLGSPLSARKSTKSPVFSVQENVGGTTYFYTPENLSTPHHSVVMPNFTMYPGILPHVAHMRIKSNMPPFFLPDELKMEVLNRHAIMLAQVDPELMPDIPQEVDNYHYVCPLEAEPLHPLQKSSTFGYHTSVYKATNTKDGLTYCLRRIHGFRLVNTKCMALIDVWKKLQHSNIVQLREVFTTKAFGDHSMVFVYDFHPHSFTLMEHHFGTAHAVGPGGSITAAIDSRYPNTFPYGSHENSARGFDKSCGTGGRTQPPPPLPTQQPGLLAESLIWAYVVQLSSALRTIHAHNLACRVMDPTKILLTDKSRIRLNCSGIFDVISFDVNQSNPLAMMPHYQQEDLVSLGKVVLALACNSVAAIQREHVHSSIELVSRNYSMDLKNLILYLLTNQNRMRSVNDIMPMIGARFYTQLDAAQLRSDAIENELSKEVENSRLFRLISKFGAINDRAEFQMDRTWSETGDRYILKLFRDYLFHQVDENGSPWLDMAHIVQSLNKLDSGVSEKICLMSRDEQSILVVSYAELKQCFESAFAELIGS